MDTVYLSDSAFRDVVLETAEHPAIETGGILLGTADENGWYVVEVLDPGPRTVRSAAYFEYNHSYATHLAGKVARRYAAPLRLLGLWHRHPGSLDTFSSVDHETHREYLRLLRGSFLSMLVNVDPRFRMTFYRVEDGPRGPRAARLRHLVGDGRFPAALLQGKDVALLADGLGGRLVIDWDESAPATEQNAQAPRPGVLGQVWNAVTGGAPRVPPPAPPAPQYHAYDGEDAGPAPPRVSEEMLELFDLLAGEFDYLNRNGSLFVYLVCPQEPALRVEVRLVKNAPPTPYPPRVEFLFYYRGAVPVAAIDGGERPYRPGVVQEHYRSFETPAPPAASGGAAQEQRHDGPAPPPDRPHQ
jgi:hypothetical protein